MIIYDISMPLHAQLAVWPGDVPFSIQRSLAMRDGAPVNLSSITMSVHAGSHMDAPKHFSDAGEPSEGFDIRLGIGRALLLDVSGHTEIGRSGLSRVEQERPERLLLRTGAWRDFSQFPDEVPVLALDVPDYLKVCGVRLLGVDVPSVDSIASKELPVHNRLLACGITILESLDLAEPPEGIYEMIALPMRIVGSDAAPVRALLKGI